MSDLHLKRLTLPPGKVFMLFCPLLILLSKSTFFEKDISGILSERQTDLIQTVCKKCLFLAPTIKVLSTEQSLNTTSRLFRYHMYKYTRLLIHIISPRSEGSGESAAGLHKVLT